MEAERLVDRPGCGFRLWCLPLGTGVARRCHRLHCYISGAGIFSRRRCTRLVPRRALTRWAAFPQQYFGTYANRRSLVFVPEMIWRKYT